jgi:thiol peroxidase
MATTSLGDNPVQTVGELPAVGSPAPSYTLTGVDMADVTSESTSGQRVVLNIFPSIGTGVCAASVRRFNELAAGLDNTAVVCASADLPFALQQFCGAEGIENVTAASSFRSTFGADYGIAMADGAWRGLLARAVVVIDTDGSVRYTELVPAIGQEPDYDAAVAALG